MKQTSEINSIEKLLKGKLVALVGNAASLLNHSSNEIDEYDIVVRINKGPLVAKEKDNIGKRTDMLLISAFQEEMEQLMALSTHTIYMSPSKRDLLSERQKRELFFYPSEWWELLYEKIGQRPSTGCMGIDLISRLIGEGELHLYGFDFWRSPTSYNGVNRPGPHSPSAEESFALESITSARIHQFL